MMRKSASTLLVAGTFVPPLLAGIAEPIKVEGGLVSGTPGWGWNVRGFRGIPFAAPPAGNSRWRPPQPVVPWQGVRGSLLRSHLRVQYRSLHK
jgi:carboxylesterase type B